MPSRNASSRTPLTRERVLRAAVDLAHREGLGALTMRRLGAELDVEAMSLYKHVAGKEAILDGIVELVVGEIEIPSEEADWKGAMRRRAVSARQVLGRHPWAIGLLESRSAMGPNVLRYLDTIIGSLRSAGFSPQDAAHAFWLLDSYVYGHVVQETSMRFGSAEERAESPESTLAPTSTSDYPHLVELMEHALVSRYSIDAEFEFGLELVLDALEQTATRAAG